MVRLARLLLTLMALGLLVAACSAEESDAIATGTTEVPDEPTEVAPASTEEVISDVPAEIESVEEEPEETTTTSIEESTTTTATPTTTSTTTTTTTIAPLEPLSLIHISEPTRPY